MFYIVCVKVSQSGGEGWCETSSGYRKKWVGVEGAESILILTACQLQFIKSFEVFKFYCPPAVYF
jgi:hypothetical protein